MIISVHTLILIFSCLFATIILLEILPPFGVKQINVLELNDLLKEENEDCQYIDVRPEPAFNRLHVYGFKNIPLKNLQNELDQLTKDKKVVVISERGTYSNKACKLLKRKGFSDLTNVRGGIITWEPHGGLNQYHRP